MPAQPDQLISVIDALLDPAPVLPVLTVADPAHAVPLAETLVAAGLPVLEVTLRTPAALDAISAMRTVSGARVGAGTILTADDLARARDAGAEFAISPGCTRTLYEAAASIDIPFLPAVATASEIIAGLERGYRRFKFFPAEAAGGITALKSFAGPFGDVKFCPTGGIGPSNAADYLRLANVLTVGGSWMVPTDAVQSGDWDRIAALATDAVNLLDRQSE
ncbi:MAG: bifunctional 4-hydroxy-2-oxoglutarate aldolase/2-dehydro-3-deoxy-phosphogluconate aldolase [Wenzhouxiangellaceae bacterium]|nr:bifunctional 4-hydroxy-2-oxoglutarate aldolase/2-dehydro-3-deoxy-phosphogluconate aldolase [Wenzhouxiangellaceae bacterium]